jgi:hypothetical protein
VTRTKSILAVVLSSALVIALALSLLGGTGSSSTQGPPARSQNEFFGIVQGIRLDVQDFETMAATGVGSDRFLMIWSTVQPKKGAFNWGPTDALVGGFASHGIRAFPSLWGSPRWVASSTATPPLASPELEQAWRKFLEAAVERYGPGGRYWGAPYHHRYGADAKPLPIESWQVWNEPNLKKYFAPTPSVEQYAKLVQISHDAITSKDPNAEIVLAGMPGFGDIDAWDYLQSLYAIPGIQGDFDAVALHPYATNLRQLKEEIERVRAVVKANADHETPLWLTEVGWGSAPPDRFGLSQGIEGQRRLLAGSYRLILSHRKEWNVKRLFWFDWRDPSTSGVVKCSFCASAGLLKFNRTPKPAYDVFKRFATGR